MPSRDVEDDIRVGAAVAASCSRAGWGFSQCRAHVDEARDDGGVIAGAVGDGRAAAELDLAVLRGVDAGRVGGVGDIEDDADIGPEAVRGHLCAVAADFLLHGIDGDERGARLLLCAARRARTWAMMNPPSRLSRARPTMRSLPKGSAAS